MSDFDRYISMIRRQKKKLEHARVITPALFDLALEIGRGQSLNEIAKGLTRNGVKPQEHAREGAKWTAQQVSDLVYLDGLEPISENLWLSLPANKLGFRVVACRDFSINRTEIRDRFGAERLHWEEERLREHVREIEEVALGLRRALGLL